MITLHKKGKPEFPVVALYSFFFASHFQRAGPKCFGEYFKKISECTPIYLIAIRYINKRYKCQIKQSKSTEFFE